MAESHQPTENVDQSETPQQVRTTTDEQARNQRLADIMRMDLHPGIRGQMLMADYDRNISPVDMGQIARLRRFNVVGTDESRVSQRTRDVMAAWSNAWTTLQDDGTAEQFRPDENAGQTHRSRIQAEMSDLDQPRSRGPTQSAVRGGRSPQMNRPRGGGRGRHGGQGGRGGGNVGRLHSRTDTFNPPSPIAPIDRPRVRLPLAAGPEPIAPQPVERSRRTARRWVGDLASPHSFIQSMVRSGLVPDDRAIPQTAAYGSVTDVTATDSRPAPQDLLSSEADQFFGPLTAAATENTSVQSLEVDLLAPLREETQPVATNAAARGLMIAGTPADGMGSQETDLLNPAVDELQTPHSYANDLLDITMEVTSSDPAELAAPPLSMHAMLNRSWNAFIEFTQTFLDRLTPTEVDELKRMLDEIEALAGLVREVTSPVAVAASSFSARLTSPTPEQPTMTSSIANQPMGELGGSLSDITEVHTRSPAPTFGEAEYIPPHLRPLQVAVAVAVAPIVIGTASSNFSEDARVQPLIDVSSPSGASSPSLPQIAVGSALGTAHVVRTAQQQHPSTMRSSPSRNSTATSAWPTAESTLSARNTSPLPSAPPPSHGPRFGRQTSGGMMLPEHLRDVIPPRSGAAWRARPGEEPRS